MSDRFHVLLSTDLDPNIQGYRKRRVFSKARSGCSTCKSKKVKCDEVRPVCTRCRRNQWGCEYSQNSNAVQNLKLHGAGPGGDQSNANATILYLNSHTVPAFQLGSAKNGTPSFHLMKHCHDHWEEIFQINFGVEILSAFQANPLVRTIILGIASCHLRHLSAGDLRHRIAEHYHQSLALEGYRKTLKIPPNELGQSGFNQLFLSGTLLNILAFPLPAPNLAGTDHTDGPCSSWVSSDGKDELGWIALQAGLRAMLKSVGSYGAEAINYLSPIFAVRNEAQQRVMAHGLEGIPKSWLEFFEVKVLSNAECECSPSDLSDIQMDGKNTTAALPRNAIFLAPMLMAAYLTNIEPIPTNVFYHFAFLVKMHPKYRALLRLRDERALWLYGYWSGLMCRFKGLWWTQGRSRRDYEAVRLWLEKSRLTQLPGPEGSLWKDMMAQLELAPIYSPPRMGC